MAGAVRAQIADGTLKPGALAPSGAALSRATGYSGQVCRRALRSLISTGELIPGASLHSRARVAIPGTDGPIDSAVRQLSAALAARRLAAGLTQHELAALIGYSKTTVCHAETGRTWQGREFWECADDALQAGGELLRLYDGRRGAGDPVGILAFWGDGAITAVPAHLADFIISGLRADPGRGSGGPRKTGATDVPGSSG